VKDPINKIYLERRTLIEEIKRKRWWQSQSLKRRIATREDEHPHLLRISRDALGSNM